MVDGVFNVASGCAKCLRMFKCLGVLVCFVPCPRKTPVSLRVHLVPEVVGWQEENHFVVVGGGRQQEENHFVGELHCCLSFETWFGS